jgi:hypothetical protein
LGVGGWDLDSRVPWLFKTKIENGWNLQKSVFVSRSGLALECNSQPPTSNLQPPTSNPQPSLTQFEINWKSNKIEFEIETVIETEIETVINFEIETEIEFEIKRKSKRKSNGN